MRSNVGVSNLFSNKPFKTYVLFLAENLNDNNPDGKLARTLNFEWKEKLSKAIDDDILNDASIGNWLEKPRWLRGDVYHLPIQNLKKKFDQTSHFRPDIFLGLIKNADTFMNDIDAKEREESVIVLATLDEHQEK